MASHQDPAHSLEREDVPLSTFDPYDLESSTNGHDPNPFASGLVPPRFPVPESSLSTPRDSIHQSPSPDNSVPLLGATHNVEKGGLGGAGYSQPGDSVPWKSRRSPRFRLLLIVIPLCIVALILVVVLPVYFAVIKNHPHSAAAAGSTHSGTAKPTHTSGPTPPPPSGATSGGDGSTVTTDNGTTFIYHNPFGGYWVSDPQNPFSNDARPNSWTPPLNTSWTWGTDRVFGVNLGGWFVLEPFISPALFQKYPGAVDEWTLSTLMAADTASGGLNQLEQHYDTFITEQDFAQIAGAGLNWVRVPIPFWAIDTWPGEPFLARTCWQYILRMLAWARKYGLRVNLDLHTTPGSQNGYNHSGKLGQINFLYGTMGIANAERMLNYIRIITEFISQPEYQNVVPMFSVINEPLLSEITKDVLGHFYLEAHQMIRGITGIGANNGPYICIHDGFQGPAEFVGFLTGADRMVLDTHPYFAFDGDTNTAPIGVDGKGDTWPAQACNWGPGLDGSQTAFGVTIAGEWSTGYNDCGLFLIGVGQSATYGGDCSLWQDASTWNATVKSGVMDLALATMDALGNWFFWTWKVGPSTSGIVESPLWSYQHGLDNGYIPPDPRQAAGVCAGLTGVSHSFDGTYLPWQTGGAGAGTISNGAQYQAWPPTSLADHAAASSLPTYTSTGTVNTLPPPTFAAYATVSVGNGWFDAGDTGLAPTTIAGCTYPDPWNAQDVAVPPLCT